MSTEVQKLMEPYIDLGNLLLIDRDPIESQPNLRTAADQLNELTRDNVQCLFNKIWTLPRKIVENATCAELPECEYALPREKPIPKPKQPTKWEQFAKAKGIVKTKKSKKVWDEMEQDWKPRYGYRRANDDKKDWLIEIPDQADPYKDYFAERTEAKRERASKQEVQRLKNIVRAQAATNPPEVPAIDQMAEKPHIEGQKSKFGKEDGKKQFSKDKEERKPLGLGTVETKSKEQITHQLHRAKSATASMGKFQPALKDEKPPKNMGIKRKFEPNEGNAQEERKRQMEILEKLQSKKPKLAEARLHAVNEHMQKEKRKSEGTDGPQKPKKRPAGRSKSQIDRQQRFQHIQKQSKKSGFKTARSKAGKAAGRKAGGSGGKGKK